MPSFPPCVLLTSSKRNSSRPPRSPSWPAVAGESATSVVAHRTVSLFTISFTAEVLIVEEVGREVLGGLETQSCSL